MSAKEVLAHAAQALEDAATSHKRAASYHRRQAIAAREKLARLKQAAQRMGIKVITTKAEAKRHGPHS